MYWERKNTRKDLKCWISPWLSFYSSTSCGADKKQYWVDTILRSAESRKFFALDFKPSTNRSLRPPDLDVLLLLSWYKKSCFFKSTGFTTSFNSRDFAFVKLRHVSDSGSGCICAGEPVLWLLLHMAFPHQRALLFQDKGGFSLDLGWTTQRIIVQGPWGGIQISSPGFPLLLLNLWNIFDSVHTLLWGTRNSPLSS